MLLQNLCKSVTQTENTLIQRTAMFVIYILKVFGDVDNLDVKNTLLNTLHVLSTTG